MTIYRLTYPLLPLALLLAGCPEKECVSSNDCNAGEVCIAEACEPGPVEADEGVSPADEGVEDPDEGVVPPDEGVVPPDEGVEPPDEGVEPPDEGIEPPDEGVEPPDEGVESPDEGTPPDEGVEPDACAPLDERCNGLDDDCDGTIDEDPMDVPAACETGMPGPCATGAGRCDQGAVVCDAPAPAAEICDDIDNDCDGQTDEEAVGIGEACETGETGVCGPGSIACSDGAEVCVRDVEPADELCDGVDDDCDGSIDEAFPTLGTPCTVGAGQCAAESLYACAADGADVECPIAPGEPADEACDGLDRDCDGAVDEAFPGQGDDCTVGVGACAQVGGLACIAGETVCADDEGPVLAGEPGDEVCNEIDDDCDGVVDDVDGLGDPCTTGIGACTAAGVFICDVDGLTCDAQPGQPTAEICNGIDDDCNGVDDDVEGLGGACTAGLGECVSEGVLVCGDGPELACDAQPRAPAPQEICPNDLDDDCDGEYDEGPFPCSPFVLTGGRITWAAGTSQSVDPDHPYTLTGRGRVVDSRALSAEAPDGTVYELRPAGLQMAGGVESVGHAPEGE